MELFVRIWRYLLAEPFTWVVCCFFGPTRFQKDIEIVGYFDMRRMVPMLRASVLLFLCFFPLFCVAVGIENRTKALDVDTSTFFSLCIWFFLGCVLLGVLGGVILG